LEHRRSDRRYDRKIAIEIAPKDDSAPFASYTRNISLGGVFVEADRAMPFGARVTVKFKVPTQSDPIVADGQVRWVETEDGQVRGVGIRFDGLRARDVWALNKFFERPIEDLAK
jgi:uncharacterized protein (TIGR02266 family)